MGVASPDYKAATLVVGDFVLTGFAALYEVFDVRDARGERRGAFETDQILTTNLPIAAQLSFADGNSIDVVVASTDLTLGGPNAGSRLLLFRTENMSLTRMGDDDRQAG